MSRQSLAVMSAVDGSVFADVSCFTYEPVQGANGYIPCNWSGVTNRPGVIR